MIIDGINENGGITSFLMIGQSNMAGRGEIGDVEPIKNPACFMLRMGRWQTMSEPINVDRAVFNSSLRSGISLAASFADSYAKHFGQKVGLIPCADGGTQIDQWMPGEILFDHAVMMTKLAMRTSTLGGILWHQGSSDCARDNAEELIATYQDKLLTMMGALRKELGAEELPLLIGELTKETPHAYGRYTPQMNRIFHEVAQKLPNCRVVSAKGLGLKEDGMHFHSHALREFGNRYFDAYLDVRGQTHLHTGTE